MDPCDRITVEITGATIPHLGYFECVFGNLTNTLLGLAGIALFIMLLIGGFKYLTAGGNPKNIEAAKMTLTYAILGVIATASVFLVLRLIEAFTGANVTNFVITR